MTFLFWMTCLLQPVWGRDDLVPGSRYTSSRAAALGDAFLPLGDDTASALFYNPAAIGKIQRPQTEGVNFQLHGNDSFLGSIGFSNLSAYKIMGLSGYVPTLQQFGNERHSAGAAIIPGFATPGFAIGGLLQSEVSAHANSDGTLSYQSRYQFIPAIAVGAKLASGIVRVGYSLQWVNQAVGKVEHVSASSSNLGFDRNLTEGAGLSHLLGMALTLPYRYLPAFNIVARNVMGTRYLSHSLLSFTPDSTGAPAEEPMTLDASFSLQPKLGSGAYLNLVLQNRDITQQSGVSILGRISAGAELSYQDEYFFRAGWGSGYPALGIALRRKSGAEVSIAWHGVELGSGYHSERDTHYLFQYQMRQF